MFPSHIKDTGEPILPWPEVTQREQVILDMRKEVDRQNVKLNRFVNTFKATACDVFQDRPQLISYEKVTPSDWRTSVHDLKDFNQTLQITADEGNKIAMTESDDESSDEDC